MLDDIGRALVLDRDVRDLLCRTLEELALVRGDDLIKPARCRSDMDPARTTAAAMESALFSSDMETSSLLRFVEQAGRTPRHRLWRSPCFFTPANGSGSAVDSARCAGTVRVAGSAPG
jgi:hypothetical protein